MVVWFCANGGSWGKLVRNVKLTNWERRTQTNDKQRGSGDGLVCGMLNKFDVWVANARS